MGFDAGRQLAGEFAIDVGIDVASVSKVVNE